MNRLLFVSSDSHAGVPHDLWPVYLENRYHDQLPRLREEHAFYRTAISLYVAKGGRLDLPETEEAYRSGYHGLYDAGLRLADMDREGVAAELIYFGDGRLGDLFNQTSNGKYPLDVWAAGARAWNRWAADNFGFARDRFLVVGAVGPCVDMDSAVAELDWIADHGFVGTYAPGHMRHPDMPPLFDPYWEPFWSACEERGLAVVVHAGFGWEQGVFFGVLEQIYNAAAEAAGSTELEDLLAHRDAVDPKLVEWIRTDFAGSAKPRRPMWQMMLGGVFDRHPGLKLLLTEIRADWIPATLGHLDAIFETHRAELPAARQPSEYWLSNCMASASFIHRAEVAMRHEIGLETLSFGRDFPHPEGTWPHTREWLRDAFVGVPEPEVRQILGGNVVSFLGLDEPRLNEYATRIGLPMDDILGEHPALAPELIDNFNTRGGYLKPAEAGSRLPEIDDMLRPDLAAFGALP